MILGVVAVIIGLQILVAEEEGPCNKTTPLIPNEDGVNYTGKAATGQVGNDFWEVWNDPDPNYAAGTATIYGADAAFKAEWNNSGNFLTRVGLHYESDERIGCHYREYGKITGEYSYDRARANGLSNTIAGEFSYIGVYGWAKNPLVEFYIIDDWFGNQYQLDSESVGNGTICYDVENLDCKVGTYEMDGGKYDVYKKIRGLTYSIEGNDKVFYQYYSVRQDIRSCGTISVDEHFKKWEELDMHLNQMYEVKIFAQAGGGEGWIDYYYAKITDEKDCSANITEDACLVGETRQTGGTTYTEKQKKGTKDNKYAYELYSSPDDQFQSGSMTLYEEDATFKATWKNSGDFLARVGLQFEKDGKLGCKFQDYGNIVATYSYTRANSTVLSNILAGDYSYIGIYGWARNPLVEFYIIDDWFGNQYFLDNVSVSNYTICHEQPDCQVGNYTVDESEYYVYNRTRIGDTIDNIPDATVVQYYSVRQSTRHCGTINVHEHFKRWDDLGLPLNEMYEAKILVQSGGGEGWIDYSSATITTESVCTTGRPICTGSGDNCNTNCGCPASATHCDATGAVCSNKAYCTGTNDDCNTDCVCPSTTSECDTSGKTCRKPAEKSNSAISWNVNKLWVTLVALLMVFFPW